jgi:hypothetical protein
LRRPNTEGGHSRRLVQREPPGSLKQASLLHQHRRVFCSLDLQKSDATAIGCYLYRLGGQLKTGYGAGAKGHAHRYAKRLGIYKRAAFLARRGVPPRRARLGIRTPGREERLQPVDVFLEERLAVQVEQIVNGLLFRLGAGPGGGCHILVVTGATPRQEEPESQEHAQVLAQMPHRTVQ